MNIACGPLFLKGDLGAWDYVVKRTQKRLMERPRPFRSERRVDLHSTRRFHIDNTIGTLAVVLSWLRTVDSWVFSLPSHPSPTPPPPLLRSSVLFRVNPTGLTGLIISGLAVELDGPKFESSSIYDQHTHTKS